MGNKLEILQNNRDKILLAEIGALIHDLGKLSEEFVKSKCEEDDTSQLYEWYAHQYILGRIEFISDLEVIVKVRDRTESLKNLTFGNLKQILGDIDYDINKDKIEESIRRILGLEVSRTQIKNKIMPVLISLKKELKTVNSCRVNKNIVKILNNINIEIINERCSISDIISCHHNNREQELYSKVYSLGSNELIKLLQRSADGLDSGIDKGAIADINKQSIDHTYISTSFGYEFEKINLDDLKKYREDFVKTLEGVLTELNNKLGRDKLKTEDWIRLRNELLDSAKKNFLHGLGETRRSANDVTLWDHSYSTASLYKTAIAEIFLSGNWKDPRKIKWRLLAIRFNGLDYISKSVKVGDILGRKEAIKDALDCVKCLLEVIIPIGNEIYRDENGSVFLIPESVDTNFLENEKFKLDNLENDNLKEEILKKYKPENGEFSLKQMIGCIFKHFTKNELKPLIKVSESSRGAVNLGSILEDTKVGHNIPFIEEIAKYDGKKSKVCVVCGLKLAKDGELCEDCKDLRRKRAETWFNNRLNHKSSIWIDEIADENGRVGIIVGSFDLRNWLNGTYLNTCFTKTIDDLKKEDKTKDVFYEIDSWDTLVDVVKEAFDKNNPEDELSIVKPDETHVKVKELLKAIGGESYHGESPEKFFEAIIEEREADSIKRLYGIESIKDLPNEDKALLLVLALFRKNPSFARIRRIWETTKRFWENVENKIVRKTLKEKQRFKIKFDEEGFKPLKNTLIKNYAYELVVNGKKIAIFYPGGSEFIIVDNLDYLGINENELNKLGEKIKNGEFEIRIPSNHGKHGKKIFPNDNKDKNIFQNVGIAKDSGYIPYSIILEESQTFITVVPLKDIYKLFKEIKKEYEIQFSKVQNRLPLKLGLIAFKRKFPLYSVFATVKRFLKENIYEKEFIIEKIEELSSEENCEKYDGKLGNRVKKIKLKSENREFEIYTSYSLGDPSKEDNFYPYFIVTQYKEDDDCLVTTLKYIKNDTRGSNSIDESCKVRIKHVKNLNKGDKVEFESSIFDFEYLDSNIRRFDLGVKRKHWLFTNSENKPKPYLLWDLDNFERLNRIIKEYNLTNTQIMNLYELLISKIEEWELKNVDKLKNNKEFRKFVENSILDIPLRLKTKIKKREDEENREFLINSILNGLFFDFVDLWHTILKKDFGGDENE